MTGHLWCGPADSALRLWSVEGLKTVVVERWAVGQASSSPKIENYLVSRRISGADLAERAREQACRFGAEILQGREGIRGEFTAGQRVGYLADEQRSVAQRHLRHRNRIPPFRLAERGQFLGAGIYYGAGSSEASLLWERACVSGWRRHSRGKRVHLSRVAKIVTMVVRGDSLKTTLSSYLIDRIRSAPNMEVLTNTEVVALEGDSVLRAITLQNRLRRREEDLPNTLAVLFASEGAPHTDWALQ